MDQQEMSQTRNVLRRSWMGVTVLLTVISCYLAWVYLHPTVPDKIQLLTGASSSAYFELGNRYAEDLRRRGLNVEVVVTGGALDNARLLTTNKNAIGFSPSLIDWNEVLDGESQQLVGLASIGLEPIWLFCRSDLSVQRIPDLTGKTVATEGVGSASDHIAKRLIARNQLNEQITLQTIEAPTAPNLLKKFRDGSVDAVVLSGSSTSPLIKAMLESDGVSLMPMERATAYAKLVPGITEIAAPEGVFNLARNIPSSDAKMLANTTCLIANKEVAPAVVPMLLVTAENVRHQNQHFTSQERFPSSDHLTLPVAWSASRYFRQGQVGLSKYLPYQVTRFINQLGFLVLPTLTVAVLMLKIAPMAVKSWGGFQLRRHFRVLEAVEKKRAAGDSRAELLSDLERLDKSSASMFVPRSLSHDYVDFRQFLHDLRDRVRSDCD